MADSILRLQVESQEYDAKLKRATEGLQRYVDGCRKVGGTLEVVKKDTLEYVRSLGQMETVSRSATGKLSEMKRAFTELSMQYKQMTDAERQSPMGKALSQSLDQLNGRIAETKRQMDDVSRDMNGGGGLGGALDALVGKFGLNINQLAGWGAALAAAKTALDTAKDAFFASEETVDEWGRTMASAGSLYEGFLNAINTGDISGYLDRIDQISTAAKAAYNELDRLGTMKTIQAPQMVRQETENQRMRTMLMTGRYIAPADGRPAANGMKTGDLLSPAQIKNIERHLQNGMQTIVGLTKNELSQTGRAIDAYYNKLAKQNGISLNEFRKGTASMEAYENRLSMAQKYRQFESAHTTLRQVYNPQIADYETKPYRDNVVNPYAKYRGWEVFRVDKMGENSYNDLVGLIRQQQQQTGQLYSTIGQSYRTINRVEGVTPNKLLHGGSVSGSGKGGGSTATDPVSKATDEVTKAEQSYAESINIAQEKLMANVMKSEEYDKLVLSGQERLADAYLKAYNATGNDQYLNAFRETSEHILDMRGVVDANIQAQKLAEQATREQAEATKKLADAERKRSEQYANWQSNTTSGIASYVSYQQGLLGQQAIGTSDYAQVAGNLADANAYKNLMQIAIQNGLNDIVVDAAPLWQKIIGETDIQDSTWQQLQDKINAKLKELGVDTININFATGNEAKQSGNKAEKHENQIGKVVSGVTSITNSLQHIGVEIPEGFNKVINIMNIIQTIMTTVGSFGSAGSFLSNIPLIGSFFSLFGLANGGVVHAANGFSGIVPGNLMSNDQVPALLNSGEVVLNRAQAGVLASDMRQGSIDYGGRTQAVIESDQIKLVLRNGAQARGMTLSDYLEL